ncbi:MAG TPA: HD domain-containing phosphohydrolase, partial [Sumerlaeia bacterium]|nr:HD domain-containing phosphohydrolase [Sumerlaeia bacterium]
MKSLQEWHQASLKIEQALRALHLLTADAGLYTDNHPKFQATLSEVLETWEQLLRELGEVELKRVGRDLIYEDVALQNHINTTREFTRGLEERGIESLIIKEGLTLQELVEYAHYMRLSGTRRKEVGSAGQFLRDRGVRHIEAWRLGSLRDIKEGDAHLVHALPVALKDMRAFRRDAVRVIDNINKEAKVARVLDLGVASTIVATFLEESAANSGLMLGLSSIRSADEYTATHSLNTCILSICICRYIGVEESVMPSVGVACLLHDIGKMFVPDAILNKPSRLTPEEWAIMEHHTTMGARFLLSIPGLSPLAPVVAYEHHMNFDRSGYPRPRRSHRINLISLVASLADFYDALSTARPYKRAVPPAEVVALLEKMDDSKMDPRLRRLF